MPYQIEIDLVACVGFAECARGPVSAISLYDDSTGERVFADG